MSPINLCSCMSSQRSACQGISARTRILRSTGASQLTSRHVMLTVNWSPQHMQMSHLPRLLRRQMLPSSAATIGALPSKQQLSFLTSTTQVTTQAASKSEHQTRVQSASCSIMTCIRILACVFTTTINYVHVDQSVIHEK